MITRETALNPWDVKNNPTNRLMKYKELYHCWEISGTKLTFTEWLDKFYPDRIPMTPNNKPKIKAYDYKGKWFVLMDENRADDEDYERPEVNVEWVMGKGLAEHVENCTYYGIPAYIGDNQDLKDKIEKLYDPKQ